MPDIHSSAITPAGTPGGRFFALLATGLLALCAGYAALVLHSAPWAEARQLDRIFPFYEWRTRPFSAAELTYAWRVLATTAGLLALAALALALKAAGRRERAAWTQENRQVVGVLLATLRGLTRTERQVAGWVFVGLTALRTVMSLPAVTPEYDDAASYTLFVTKGLLAVSAYYPLPNNHVLSNTVSWLFYQAHPGFWWTMRLPVVLAATGACVLLFVGLLRARAGFRPALLAIVLFSLAQLSLYHAAVGRGYWLLSALAGVVFFCALALGAGTARPRTAWAALVVGGVLGLYTVPTFALVLASAFSWMGVHFCLQRAGKQLVHLTLAAVLVAIGSLVLYAPLLFVSGPGIFFGNGFVAPRPVAEIVAGLPKYLWQTEGFLAGQVTWGGLLAGAVLGATVLLWRRALTGRLPQQLAAPWRRLVPAALWFMAFPYAMLAAQRVFAPGRTLLYKAFFLYLLLALVVEWLLHWPAPRGRRWVRPALLAAALLWTGYQFESLWRDNRVPRQHNADYHAAFAWLASQPLAPVLVPEPTHSIFLRLYFLSERPSQPWQLDGRPQAGRAYRYVVAFPNKRGYFQPIFTIKPAYQNQEVEIYRVPAPTGPVPEGLPPYWHLND